MERSASGGIDYSADDIDTEFANTLDFNSIVNPANWQPPGEYYQSMPLKLRAAVNAVVESDQDLRNELRNNYMPEMLRSGALMTWERANPRYIEALQRKRLYTGQVVASDGTIAKYETLSLVGAQIAISRVSYQETTGQIVSNIMHWGSEVPKRTTAADIASAIRSRGQELRAKMPNLFLYALMTYKERQVLLDTPPGTFRLIQGTLFPHEMLTGSGRQFIMDTCLNLIGQLIDEGSYATIVSNDSHWELLNIGMALDPGEFIVVNSGTEVLAEFRQRANYTSTPIPQYGGKSQIQLFEEFKQRYGPKVVRGVLRAHIMSKPYIFYCNADQVPEAVHMLLADAANTGARGFPLLIDLADQLCSGAFRAGEYTDHINAEFARASRGSAQYHSEHSTRDYIGS